MAEIFDVLIIGSGAVGCAVAREMAILDQKCIILEKNMEVISEASSGNTGHLTRGFYYTKDRAPLEYQIIRKMALEMNQGRNSEQQKNLRMLFDDFLVMRQIGLTQKLSFCSGEMGF